MNHLPVAGDDTWHLPQHAHVIVHETDEGAELLTIYDCGAAQKPPSAQLIGNLVRVDATHELVHQPTGYIAKLRERATLERQDADHWVIRAGGDADRSP
ncbi:hypothetical protein ACKVMT_05420 [Halobacteriales archaeon Cl-PHB]